MNKTIKILLICMLSMLCIILAGIMVFVMKNDFNGFSIYTSFNATNMKLVDSYEAEVSAVNKFYLNLKSTDVEIKDSTNGKILVEYYSNLEKNVKIEYKDNTIIVNEATEDTIQNNMFMNVCKKVVLYVPTEYTGEYEIITMSGDTKSEIDLSNNKVNISSKSGDIFIGNSGESILKTVSGDIKANKLGNADVSTTSGDVTINVVENANIATTSGDIEVNEIKGIANVATVSGDVEINKLNNSAEIATTSGDIDIGTLSIKESSKITSTSGDVKISNNECNCYVDTDTTSGDAKINKSDRKSDIVLTVKTMSGDIKVEG